MEKKTEPGKSRKLTSKEATISLKLNKKILLVVGGVLIAGVAAFISINMLIPTPLESAYSTCNDGSDRFTQFASLDEDGRGLFLDGGGDESVALNIDDLSCVITALETPSSVLSRMNSTTSLMGLQEATWEGITASWTYHPSNGLDISYELVD